MFVVEKNVQVPRRLPAKYPLADMEPGDSFLVPNGAGISGNAVRSAVRCWAKRHGASVTVCKVEDGFRVWRVA